MATAATARASATAAARLLAARLRILARVRQLAQRLQPVRQRCHRNRLRHQLLDGLQVAAFRGLAERNRDARGPRAAGAADAVHVALGVDRDVVVDDVADVVDVDAARGHVGGHQHADLAGLERIEGALPLALVLVAVDRCCLHLRAHQALHHAVGAVLGAGEDQHAPHVVAFQESLQERLLHLARDVVDALLDLGSRACHRRHFHAHRIGEERVRQVADLLRHGGREEHGLALLRHHARNGADRLDEAHVQHPVGLVEHQDVDVGEVAVALLDQVEQAAGRGHHDVDAAAQRVHLRVLPDAAVDHRGAHGRMAPVHGDALGDLHGQLARRRQHQGVRLARHARALRGVRRVGADLAGRLEPLDEGQGECRGLAGAGLRGTEDVAPFQCRRDGLGLDRGGGFVALLGKCTEERGCETK